ncbi:MAG: stage V sporulation protein SpoVM [Clostridiales bacterium]|nr:stage V sporulation protein SpoVM [Clostridiales bacterium]
MKVVVITSPKLLRGILRLIFGIKKQAAPGQ